MKGKLSLLMMYGEILGILDMNGLKRNLEKLKQGKYFLMSGQVNSNMRHSADT